MSEFNNGVEEWIKQEIEESGPMSHGEDDFARIVWPIAYNAGLSAQMSQRECYQRGHAAGRAEGMEEAAVIASNDDTDCAHSEGDSECVAGSYIANEIRNKE